ncbi:hypothetical protein IU433_08890 [Nocardia puris]|uniref:poly(ethylene terephthalate) hydrolase family protein n=1 Tax=Nocardia puris TaxID=208602 RepID=UPI001896052D|nr:hypothetical protein [Nocardia puris]MBF6364225.1 hypothetical protein [Nocardia puris]MBF6459154.1 hypothetical protein [Nocardia puris]
MRTTIRLSGAALTLLLAIALLGGRASAEAPTAQEEFNHPGAHPVATEVRTAPCRESIAGMVAHITVHVFGNTGDLACSRAFPYGLESPVGVHTYYPADIADLPSAPLLVYTPGITAEPGMYESFARRLAGHGFVVVVPYDFFNSLAYVPALGLGAAIRADRDPHSPLHGRIDLSRTFFGGHSAGGGASMQIAPLATAAAAAIDPGFRVAGILAVAPGPVGIGTALTAPTLFLTGYNDAVAPDFGWVRWWQYNLTANAPAWIANARGVGHFSPVDEVAHFRSAGTAVAWLRYLAFGDEAAARWFTGPDWLLRTDPTYFSVERNPRADALSG